MLKRIFNFIIQKLKVIFNFENYQFKHYGFSILTVILMLGSIGSYLIQYLQDSGEKQFEKQMIGIAAGILLAVMVSLIDYHFICKFFIPVYLLNFILLAAVKFSKFGASHYDAKRWLRFPDGSVESTKAWFEFQPSELSKIFMILFIAKFLDVMRKRINKWYTILLSLFLVGLPLVFIFTQPDLSTTVVLAATFIVMIFVAGISYKLVIPVIAVGAPAAVALYWYVQQPYQKLLNWYQQRRILALENPELYPDLMWQQNNAAKAIKSGGMVGKIFTEDITSLSCDFIAAIESDFIFTAIAEGFGFVGCLVVIVLFASLIFKCLNIARHAVDQLGTLIAAGVGSLIMLQVFVNIGVVTTLLPNTGIPLPFVSSGLSALLSNMLMIGVVLNVSIQRKAVRVEDSDFI